VAEIDWQLGNLTGATGFGRAKVTSPEKFSGPSGGRPIHQSQQR